MSPSRGDGLPPHHDFSRARLLQHLGDTTAALEQFEAVLKTHPDSAPARDAVAKLKPGP